MRLTDYELKGVGAADPQWNNEQGAHPSTVVFTVQPVGWVGEWHENPAPQWIVVLPADGSSRAWTAPASSRGQANSRSARIRAAPRHDGKKGHRSGTIGDDPAA